MLNALLGSRSIIARTLQLMIVLAFYFSAVADAQSGDGGRVFDHSQTGFGLEGSHAFVPCQSCHIDGQFAGTPRNCISCHSLSGRINATPKPIDHIPTTDQCDACHSPTLWPDIARVDHMQVIGPCIMCHNNQQVYGQHPNHIPTSNHCSDCHSELSWLPVNFNHDGLTNCVGCHNNVQAQGQPADHILSLNTCDSCHTNTVAWTPVPSVDHDAVIGTCSSCHNNVVVSGQPPDHIPTGALECTTCHSLPSWYPATLPGGF